MKNTMKAALIGAVAVMLLLPSLSLAQGIKFGLKVGMNSADLFGDEIKEMEQDLGEELVSKWGFCAGGFIRFSLAKTFAIQPEFLYTMKGAKMEAIVLDETMKFEFNLTYLEIPVLIKIMLPTPGIITPHLYAGPVMGIKLSGKIKAEYAGESEEEDISDELKDNDYGLIVGGGIDAGKITVEIRYVLGLTTIATEADTDVKNGVFSIMLGFSF